MEGIDFVSLSPGASTLRVPPNIPYCERSFINVQIHCNRINIGPETENAHSPIGLPTFDFAIPGRPQSLDMPVHQPFRLNKVMLKQLRLSDNRSFMLKALLRKALETGTDST